MFVDITETTHSGECRQILLGYVKKLSITPIKMLSLTPANSFNGLSIDSTDHSMNLVRTNPLSTILSVPMHFFLLQLLYPININVNRAMKNWATIQNCCFIFNTFSSSQQQQWRAPFFYCFQTKKAEIWKTINLSFKIKKDRCKNNN